MKKVLYFAAFIGAVSLSSCGGSHESGEAAATHDEHANHTEEAAVDSSLMYPEGARVFFANLTEGQEVTSPVKVEFGIEGMEVEPAGEANYGKGHHHIIINKTYIEKGTPVPTDEQHIHYGKGQTETELTLEPGDYTLTMQFANGYHMSYGEPLSATVHIKVK